MKYHGLFGPRARRRCPHSHLRGIYGDEITFVGFWRLECLDCGRYLNGPASLASTRARSENWRWEDQD